MIDKTEKTISLFMSMSFDSCRAAWIERVRAGKSFDISSWLEKNGFEPIDAQFDDIVTKDGREIMWVGTSAYVLRSELHAEQLAKAFETERKRAKEPETKSVVGTESLSAMTCPKCGDSLQHTAVCPKCAAGKLGYRHRYTCVCGGVDLISREPL